MNPEPPDDSLSAATDKPATSTTDIRHGIGEGKHPRGLRTLFFTEMWERFSFYGMRALLVLFMVDAVREGGLGFTDQTATAIYGLYTAFVYLICLPGGWIADRLLGAQRSVWYGGIIIALGHFTLAIPSTNAFFLGLVFVVLGTGLLKPNISAIVGRLYPEGGTRRDAGFTIFYMGINLGAFIGPLICSKLGEGYNWHWGFAAAGVGMLFGLVQYRLTVRHLGEAGRVPEHGSKDAAKVRRGWIGVGIGLLIVGAAVVLAMAGVLKLNPVPLARNTTYLIVGLAILYFVAIFSFGKLTGLEKRRMSVLIVLLMASAMFWSGFEQAGSSLNLFADRFTDRMIDSISFEIPAGWFQSLNPIFIIAFSPVVASIWLALGRRGLNPPLPAKFAIGLMLLGFGFLIMVFAGKLAGSGEMVMPTWLITTYALHTLGELCLSPVGLSAVTKLAPARFVGQMMGLWFLATALGNLIAGLIAGRFASKSEAMDDVFLQVVFTTVGTGLIMLLLVKPIRKLMGNVE